jgi:hypothetical protein
MQIEAQEVYLHSNPFRIPILLIYHDRFYFLDHFLHRFYHGDSDVMCFVLCRGPNPIEIWRCFLWLHLQNMRLQVHLRGLYTLENLQWLLLCILQRLRIWDSSDMQRQPLHFQQHKFKSPFQDLRRRGKHLPGLAARFRGCLPVPR